MRALRFALTAIILLGASATDAQWLNYPTPRIPRTADGKPQLDAPTPRLPNGKPDLTGLWWATCSAGTNCFFTRSLFMDLAQGLEPDLVQMTPWAAGIQKQREQRRAVDDPYGRCLPQGVPRIYFNSLFKILVTPDVTAFLHESPGGMLFREVFTDGRPLPEVIQPTWLGYSVGHWEGDSFVVVTAGLRDGGWLDTSRGRPHSDALRLTQRFTRTDLGHMELAVTVDDPKAFLKPWTATTMLLLRPDTELLEFFCENDKTMEHRVIDPAPPEPPSPPLQTK